MEEKKRIKPEGHKSRAVGSHKKRWEEAVSLLLAETTWSLPLSSCSNIGSAWGKLKLFDSQLSQYISAEESLGLCYRPSGTCVCTN